MTDLKSTAKTGRRSFLWRAGATLTAGLAAAVPGMAGTNNNEQDLKLRLARLEDEHAIRKLHKTYENYLDSGRYPEVAGLFTENAEVIFNGGIYRGKNRGISRLYRGHFSAGMTGRKMEPAPGFQIGDELQHDDIELSEDGRSARARFPYSIQVGTPVQDDSVLVQMARLHGEGIRKWWEGGTYEITCVKDTKDGSWKIKRLEHRVLARADYQPGRSQAKPIAIAPFNKVYPGEATGPDRLVTKT
jgi:hypothetical protein